MSVVLSHRNGKAAFVQLTRLFAGLKRSGRVMDVVWFQQNAEYARAMLALADENDDEAVREIAANLRQLLPDYLYPQAPPPRTAVRAPAATLPARDAETAAAEAVSPADRYIGRLR